jgi:hypothetical protein
MDRDEVVRVIYEWITHRGLVVAPHDDLPPTLFGSVEGHRALRVDDLYDLLSRLTGRRSA